MHVAITGSSGLIGSALVEALERRGDRVTRMVRGREWDPVAGRVDPAVLAAADAVVNLAGEGLGERRWNDAQKERIRSSRVDGTTALAAAIAALPAADRPSVFASGSAIGFYGDGGEEVLTEDAGRGGGFLAELAEAWEAATAAAEVDGVRVAHLRTGVVLTPTGGALQRLLLPFKLGLGGRVGGGRQWFSWISLDDEIAGILRILDDDDLAGPVNLAAPNPVRQADFAAALGRALHRPTILPTPLLPLKAAMGPDAVREMLLFSQRVAPARLERAGHVFAHPDIDSALGALLSD